jgi:hypothetical protein
LRLGTLAPTLVVFALALLLASGTPTGGCLLRGLDSLEAELSTLHLRVQHPCHDLVGICRPHLLSLIIHLLGIQFEYPVKPDGIKWLHLVLLDALPLSGEFWEGQFLDRLNLPATVAQQEYELMNEQLVHRILIVRVVHLLFLLEVSLDGPHVSLEVFPGLLLALEVWSVLLDPLADQLETCRLIYQVESLQYYVFF